MCSSLHAGGGSHGRGGVREGSDTPMFGEGRSWFGGGLLAQVDLITPFGAGYKSRAEHTKPLRCDTSLVLSTTDPLSVLNIS